MTYLYLYHIANDENHPLTWGLVEANGLRQAKKQVLQSFSDAMAEEHRFTTDKLASYLLSLQPVVGWDRYHVAQRKRVHHYFFAPVEDYL